MPYRTLRIFFVFVATLGTSAHALDVPKSVCCVCEYTNAPLPKKNVASEKRIIALSKQRCSQMIRDSYCMKSLILTETEAQPLLDNARKRIVTWAKQNKCESVAYEFNGHSGPQRMTKFVDRSFALKKEGQFKATMCSNFGCSTFQDMQGTMNYFRQKCTAESCPPGTVLQITANTNLFRPALKDYSFFRTRVVNEKPGEQNKSKLKNEHGLFRGKPKVKTYTVEK